MPRITQELLKGRAEHNEGCLSNLEEITLHQFELEKIELLETYCRHLKILYLQNNIIEKMEGLNKLKELEYLNLALNNISKIEGISGCESLKKLDFTVNFIDLEELEDSLINASRCPMLKELYLTGNPCTDWSGYRDFTIATIPQLESLDGKEITPTDRIKANQAYEDLLVDLHHKIEMRQIEKQKQEQLKNQQAVVPAGSIEVNQEDKSNEKQPYTKESRKQMYLEMAQEKEKKEREKNPEKFKEPKKESSMFRADGEIRQCNEGKYDFKLKEFDDPEWSQFELQVPKFMDTSFIDVNLDPKWVSVRVKGKLTQLRLDQEIIVEQSEIKRSQTTGALVIKMKKLKVNELVKLQAKRDQDEKKKKEEELKAQKLKEQIEREEKLKLCDKIELKQIQKKQDFTTFDDVPDLE
ncbi:hypothetical protein ABPG74_020511 [Tetrahymena malaccensis]